jgi:acyl transferase domain-containing protein
VSSFGFSGTNAHVVLEGPPPSADLWRNAGPPERSHHLLVLSARSEEALAELAGRYAEWLAVHPEADLADVCFTAGAGRSHFEHRAALVVGSLAEARELCERLRRGEGAGNLFVGQARARTGEEPAADAPVRELAGRYVQGMTPDFRAIDAPRPRRKLALPTYPFQRQRCWIDLRKKPRPHVPEVHPLLGVRLELASSRQAVFQQHFSLTAQPWIGDHRVYQAAVTPGMTPVAMVLMTHRLPACVEDVTLQEPLILPDDPPQACDGQLVISAPSADGVRRFEMYSRPTGESAEPWREHATGALRTRQSLPPFQVDLDVLRRQLRPLPPGARAGLWKGMSIDYGPALQGVVRAWVGEEQSLCEIEVPHALVPHLSDEPIHPALLDACVRLPPGLGDLASTEAGQGVFWAPWRIERVVLERAAPGRFYAFASQPTRCHEAQHTRSYDIHLVDPYGNRFGLIEGFTLKRAPREAFLRGLHQTSDRLLYHVRWQPAALPRPATAAARTWLLLGEDPDGQDLADELRNRGQHVRTAGAGEAATVLTEWVRQSEGNGSGPLAGVVWLAGNASSDPGPEAAEAVDLLRRAEEQLAPFVQLAQALVAAHRPLPTGLTVVTRRAVAVAPGERSKPLAQSLWGLGRSRGPGERLCGAGHGFPLDGGAARAPQRRPQPARPPAHVPFLRPRERRDAWPAADAPPGAFLLRFASRAGAHENRRRRNPPAQRNGFPGRFPSPRPPLGGFPSPGRRAAF